MVTFFGKITGVRNGVAYLHDKKKSVIFEIPEICREKIILGQCYEIGIIHGDWAHTEYVKIDNIAEIKAGDKIIYLKDVILIVRGNYSNSLSISLSNEEIGKQCILRLIEGNWGKLYIDKGLNKSYGPIYEGWNKNIKVIIIDWASFKKIYPKVVSEIHTKLKELHPGVPILEVEK